MPSFTFVTHRERLRAPRRAAGVRRHRPGHVQPRRARGRGGDHAADQGDRAGALRGRRLRHGRARGTSRAEHGLSIVEDAAQGLMRDASDGRPLGDVRRPGHAVSFHETKNVTCGEGGALLINDPRSPSGPRSSARRARTASRFFRGQVDKYTWVDIGSSYALSDLGGRVPVGPARGGRGHHEQRGWRIWDRYHAAFEPLGAGRRSSAGRWCRDDCEHNAHMYYLLLPRRRRARRRSSQRWRRGTSTPCSTTCRSTRSPAGPPASGARRSAAGHGRAAARALVRLPLWAGMSDEQVERVIDAVLEIAPGVGSAGRRSPRASAEPARRP